MVAWGRIYQMCRCRSRKISISRPLTVDYRLRRHRHPPPPPPSEDIQSFLWRVKESLPFTSSSSSSSSFWNVQTFQGELQYGDDSYFVFLLLVIVLSIIHIHPTRIDLKRHEIDGDRHVRVLRTWWVEVLILRTLHLLWLSMGCKAGRFCGLAFKYASKILLIITFFFLPVTFTRHFGLEKKDDPRLESGCNA